jgi:hypothetical protein
VNPWLGIGENVLICPENTAGLKILYGLPEQELMIGTYLVSCGWQAGEKVTVTKTDPAGEVTREEKTAIPAGRSGQYVDFRFHPLLNGLAGQYTIAFIGQSGTVSITITYKQPDKPHLMRVTEEDLAKINRSAGSGSHLLMFGFPPLDVVRLMVYKQENLSRYRLIGSRTYRVGTDGIQVISLDISDNTLLFCTFVAIGERAGQVYLISYYGKSEAQNSLIGDLTCPGALPPRLYDNIYAQLIGQGDEQLKVYKQPGFHEVISAQFPAGAKVKVIGGQKCLDGTYWWNVTGENGVSGWMPEAINGRYVIDPFKG